MAVAPSPQPPPTADPVLAALLGALRRRVRRYVAWEGGQELLAASGLAFWVSLLLDWLFEPAREIRWALLAVGAVLLGVVAWRRLVSRLLVRCDAGSLARILERRFPVLADSLVSAIELQDSLQRDGECSDEYRQMVAVTVATARKRSQGLPLAHVFRARPWWRATATGAAAIASLGLLAWGAPQVLDVWGQRFLQGSDIRWPRRTHLMVEGFTEGPVRIARGADLPLVVRADTRGLVPHSVQLRYEMEDGLRGRASLVRDGNADPQREPFQRFTHTFVGVLTPLVFEVSGGDERIGNLRIDVVDRPALVDTFLECTFPEYLRREPARLPATAQVELPLGTQVHLAARASKPLAQVELAALVGDAAEPVAHTVVPERGDGQRVTWDVGTLSEDVRLLITLVDRDGIQNQEPYRLHLSAQADQLPRVTVRPRGVGMAVTPGAVIPLSGEMNDDHALANATLEYAVDEAEAVRLPCQTAVAGQDEATLEEVLDVAPLGLKPGQKLSLVIQGFDHCPRGADAVPGVSDTFRFEIVTPEALHDLLESREVNLRRQLERLIHEVQDARAEVRLLDAPAEPPTADTTPAATESAPPAAAPAATRPSGVATTEVPADDRAALARLRVVRAAQLARKDAEETRGIAAAFEGIREELINNRLQTEELLGRLTGGIAEPLRRIAQEHLQKLAESCERFVEKSSTHRGLAPPTADWDEQYGTILREMRTVLERMKELETFNEAVARLRGIIEEQQRLNQETQSRRRSRARELLEE